MSKKNDTGSEFEQAARQSGLEGLTPRQREVYHLRIEGKTVLQIADALEISADTAADHLQKAHKALDSHGLADLGKIGHDNVSFRQLGILRTSHGFLPREIDFLHAILKGKNVVQASKSIGISRHTGADYMKDIYKKLGLSSKKQNVAYLRPLLFQTMYDLIEKHKIEPWDAEDKPTAEL